MTQIELNGSVKDNANPTEAFLVSNKAIVLSWTEMVEALSLYRHKLQIKEEKFVGFKVTEKNVTFLFER